MRTLWHLAVGAKAGLILLWRARRSGRTFDQQLERETWSTQERMLEAARESLRCSKCGLRHQPHALCGTDSFTGERA